MAPRAATIRCSTVEQPFSSSSGALDRLDLAAHTLDPVKQLFLLAFRVRHG